MRSKSSIVVFGVVLGLAACGADERSPESTAGGVLGTGGETGIASFGEAPRLDLGSGSVETGGPNPDDGVGQEGCKKVDFLFVIDNSGSMADEQTNLINSFPGFISTIRDTLQAQDYHLMVVDTDASVLCEQVCRFASHCFGTPCDEIENGRACQVALGAGKKNDRFDSSCGVKGDKRFITDDQQDLEATFACIAEVGTEGDGDERQNEALRAAISPEMVGNDGCNAGFLRDDALLVVTIITDEEDGPAGPDANQETPSGSPEQWVADLVDRKRGNRGAVVMLGLVGDTDLDDGLCEPLDTDFGEGAEPAPRLREFVRAFPNHVVGSVCTPDYAPFFLEAVSVIDTACDEYTPVG